MDLNKLKITKADEGATLELKHPGTDEVIPGMSINLLGQDSKKYRELARARQQVALDRVSKGKRASKLDAKELDAQTLADLVATTVSWKGFELEGNALECTPENVLKVYTDFGWVREQALEFQADRANFL